MSISIFVVLLPLRCPFCILTTHKNTDELLRLKHSVLFWHLVAPGSQLGGRDLDSSVRPSKVHNETFSCLSLTSLLTPTEAPNRWNHLGAEDSAELLDETLWIQFCSRPVSVTRPWFKAKKMHCVLRGRAETKLLCPRWSWMYSERRRVPAERTESRHAGRHETESDQRTTEDVLM